MFNFTNVCADLEPGDDCVCEQLCQYAKGRWYNEEHPHFAGSFQDLQPAFNAIAEGLSVPIEHLQRLFDFAHGGAKFRLQDSLTDAVESFNKQLEMWLSEFTSIAEVKTTAEAEQLAKWKEACLERFKSLASAWEPDENKKFITWKTLMPTIAKLHRHFIFVPTDKSPQTVAVICRSHYSEILLEGLENYNDVPENKARTALRKVCGNDERLRDAFPYFYLMPKFHKPQPWKFRDVVGTTSNRAPVARHGRPVNYTTKLARQVNDVLHGIMDVMLYQSDAVYQESGIRKTCLITRTTDFDVKVQQSASLLKGKLLRKTDFSTLYTSLKADQVITHEYKKTRAAKRVVHCWTDRRGSFIASGVAQTRAATAVVLGTSLTRKSPVGVCC